MLVLRKPDALGSSLRLKFKVEGENPVRARMSVILRRLVDGKEADVRSGVSIEQVAISAFGQHITWRRSIPEADWSVALDGASFKTAVVVQHEFSVHFNCSDGFDCAHDGDTLETIFSLDLPNERDEPKGAVTLYTRVEALPSCDHTVVQVIGLGSPDSRGLQSPPDERGPAQARSSPPDESAAVCSCGTGIRLSTRKGRAQLRRRREPAFH
jgi:hypothetical protein